MVAFLLLFTTFFTGFHLIKLLPIRWYKLEFWSISYLVGLLTTTWITFLTSLALGYKAGLGVTILGLVTASFFFWRNQAQAPSDWLFVSKKTWWTLLGYLIFWITLLSILMPTRFLQIKPDGWYSGGSTWGDLALHSTLIYSFAEHPNVDLQLPVYPQQKLTYPFMFDFYTALLVKTGFSIQTSLLITSMLTAMSLMILFFFWLLRVTGSRYIASLSSAVVFLNGNLGSWYAWQEWRESGLPLGTFLQEITKSYVLYPEKNLQWAQFLTDYLLPQRGVLVGMSVFFLVCYCFYFLVDPKHVTRSQLRLSIAILMGMLPFFHIHTFLVLCGVVGWFALTEIWNKRARVAEWLPPLGVLTLLALPQLYWQFTGNFSEGFVSFTNGWYLLGENPISFWWRNLGIEFITTLIGIGYLFKAKHSHPIIKLVVFPLIALFFICNFIIFQPNEWDNTKFFLYSHVAFVLISLLFLEYLRKKLAGGWLVSGVIVALLLSGGVLMVVREITSSWRTNSTDDLAVAAFVRKTISPTALFLTADTHNHPISMLTGRSTLLGYRGWLWTYGIRYEDTAADVLAIYHGEATALELLEKYKIEYVYIGERERDEYMANESFFQQFPLVYSSPMAEIYHVAR